MRDVYDTGGDVDEDITQGYQQINMQASDLRRINIGDTDISWEKTNLEVYKYGAGKHFIADIYREDPHQISTVNVIDKGQVIGIHYVELETFLGTIARKPTILPLNVDDWMNVSAYYKELAWTQITEKLEEKLDEQPPELRDGKTVQDDVFLEVMGPESRGRVPGAGKGVSPRDYALT
ncbi:hypothetical protein NE237_000883 [Protea cynaroides]|uniref:Uncharacterized protein n=1 Tax=Protea cynaroides TaxID=273540 RepID=A0A9Q0QXW6_9MAGN|nr:hypothetical protein NE237_000883 [Protea cynaroides]